jgi:RimJ/RimL family protein N-acetyltransferase
MIQTARLWLRAPRPDDLDALCEVFGNARAMRYWSHETHATRAQTEHSLAGMIASHSETGLELVIEHEGQVIGKAGLWRMAEIGYILHPDFWGKGLMREALEAILGEAFARPPALGAITAEIDTRNTGSERLLTGLGFTLTHRKARTLHLYGEWCDSAFYALERTSTGSDQAGQAG